MAAAISTTPTSSPATHVTNGGFTPYIRVQPDWQLLIEEKIQSSSSETKASPAVPSVATAAAVTSGSSSSDKKDAINGSGDKTFKFWVSSFEHDHRSVFDDAIITTASRTTTPTTVPSVSSPATVASSSISSESQLSATIRVVDKGLSIRVENGHRLWAHCDLTHATSYIYAPLRSYSTLHTPLPPAGHSLLPRDRIIPTEIFSMAVSPSGDLCASGSGKGSAVVWHAATGKLVRELRDNGHAEGSDVTSVRFFPSGVLLLTAGTDLSLKIWAIENGLCAATMRGHSRAITNTHIIGRGRNVLSVSMDGTARVWDCSRSASIVEYRVRRPAGLKADQVEPPLSGINDSILVNIDILGSEYKASGATETISDAEGALLVTVCDDGRTRLYDLRIRHPILEFCPLHTTPATRVAQLSSGLIVVGYNDGRVQLWDAARPATPIGFFRKNDSAITSLLPLADGHILIGSGEGDATLVKWSTPSSPLILAEFSGVDSEPVTAMASSSTWLYTSGGGVVYQYDIRTLLTIASPYDRLLPTK